VVWAFPFSLATTKGISAIYFPLGTEMFHFPRSSSYTYEFSIRFRLNGGGFPHSDIPGSKLAWELPETYRTLQRPSSSFSVKASTVRPYLNLRTTKTLKSAFGHKPNLNWFMDFYYEPNLVLVHSCLQVKLHPVPKHCFWYQDLPYYC